MQFTTPLTLWVLLWPALAIVSYAGYLVSKIKQGRDIEPLHSVLIAMGVTTLLISSSIWLIL